MELDGAIPDKHLRDLDIRIGRRRDHSIGRIGGTKLADLRHITVMEQAQLNTLGDLRNRRILDGHRFHIGELHVEERITLPAGGEAGGSIELPWTRKPSKRALKLTPSIL